MPAPSNVSPNGAEAQATINRELDNILVSGEISAIYLGDILPGNKVVVQDEIIDNSDEIQANRELHRLNNEYGRSINYITEEGLFEVDTQLPTSVNYGELRVLHYTGGTAVVQRLRDIEDQELYERASPTQVNPTWDNWTTVYTPSTYEYKKTGGITIQDTAWTDVNGLLIEHAKKGTWEAKVSLKISYDNTSRSAGFRLSINGGSTWDTFWVEPKDRTDQKAISYFFAIEHMGETIVDNGNLNFLIQGACENDADTLDIYECTLYLERKK